MTQKHVGIRGNAYTPGGEIDESLDNIGFGILGEAIRRRGTVSEKLNMFGDNSSRGSSSRM